MSAQNGKWITRFLTTHPVFTHGQFAAAKPDDRSEQTVKGVLAYHLRAGHLVRIKRGLYATVPQGVSTDSFQPDPYLVATHLAEDAVVAYHAALQFHGRAYSILNRFNYLSANRGRLLRWRDVEFVPVQVPTALLAQPHWGGGVMTALHGGATVRVTTLERTLVDVLDSPENGGGWEEVWRSLESVEFFDLDEVVHHALVRGSALTVARVGFFLEQHADSLMVSESTLDVLTDHVPRQPTYIDRRRRPGKLVGRWNLIIPEPLLERRWEEV